MTPDERCTAIMRSVRSDFRGSPCGRRAKHDTPDGPRCGYHEPKALAKRIALLLPYAVPATLADAAE